MRLLPLRNTAATNGPSPHIPGASIHRRHKLGQAALAAVFGGLICLGAAVAQEDDTAVSEMSGGNSGAGCLAGSWGCSDPAWILRGGALFMQRGTPGSSVLMFDTGAPANNINASEFNFDFETGWEVSGIRDCGDRGWEIRFMSVDGWNATESLATAAPAVVQINNTPASFFAPTTIVNATYNSELLGGEVNRRRKINDWMTVFAGFRYIELDEHFHTVGDAAAFPSTYDTFTTNRMYGGQLGLDVLLLSRDRLTLEGIAKAGLYYNDSSQASALATGPGPVFRARDTGEREAFAAELGLAGSYFLTENLSLRASYNVLFLDSVALATDQIPATNIILGTGITSSGDVFYHGAMVGFEYLH